ncbi:CheY-like superfamily [Penicillium waksmanii]|uniref:CheY-like superfamily n=1 Tax=Penicillium waksmanii TaxID=69791 RepID=UPI002547BD0D|nr:CheY-like superfamily [Penicillium waksmanii]KAJ5976431.1 CheY-like superfamily [Penicillium waksmanii]
MNSSTNDILRAYEADRQSREVYRYFQPANPAALNTTWPPPSGDHFSSVESPRFSPSATSDNSYSALETTPTKANAQSSPNTTLTSFAQLAALRLNAQRAFITILNHDFQFVLAEATKTTNIGNSELSAEGDGLFVGTSTLTQSWNICQETVSIRADEQDEDYPFLIVKDLEKTERFRKLPFVTGEPHSRFYAGTPLTSGSDINLGCLFVLDSEPREGLSVYEKDALATVAALVMDYLQVSRQATEGRRASRLSHGLHLFVDGNSSFADNAPNSSRSCSSISSSSEFPPYLRTSRSASPQDTGQEPYSTWTATSDAPQGYDDIRSSSTHSNDKSDIGTPWSPSGSLLSLRQSDRSSSASTSSKHWLFQRAANLLRQSLDLDGAGGVMFMGTSEDSSENFTDNRRGFDEHNNPAPVLALSTGDDPLSSQIVSPATNAAVTLDHDFLNQLTRRYPKGRLWSFRHDGTLSTSDEDLSRETSRKQHKRFKNSETASLNSYFPEACQVAFVPLWNGTDSQWFAGCFCWTPHPTRVFSRAVDLSSIFAFASSIMTEYSRVESVIADRQKGDFISSISHELRSPLHGILAAAEFMADTSLNDFQSSVLETINACGRTLLDTMNQVLDFSKMMSLERSKRRFKKGKDPWKSKPTDDIPQLDTFVPIDVAILTEDVVDSVALGHFHMQRSTTSTNRPALTSHTSRSNSQSQVEDAPSRSDVDLVVDIANNDWMYQVQPGSLRRLIMNLLGNSLKYTEKGLITVSIKATEMSKGRSRRQGLQDMVALTVSDTGKGISSEYLQKRLYTPFAQEDTLSVGTGLGLSIVRGIVRALNGKISVESCVGEGTTIQVLLPFDRPVGRRPHDQLFKRKALKKINLHHLPNWMAQIYVGNVPQFGVSTMPVWMSLSFGPRSFAMLRIDILFATEDDLFTTTKQDFPTSLPSLLIFCNESVSHGDPRLRWSHLADSLASIHGPSGPQKLARGILSCLEMKQTSASDSKDLRPACILPERPKITEPILQLKDSIASASQFQRWPDHDSNSMPVSQAGDVDVTQNVRSDNSELSTKTEEPWRPPSSGTSSAIPVPSSTSSPDSAVVDTPPTWPAGPRILAVDDNQINLNLLTTFLKKRNVPLLDQAENGQAAVNLVKMSGCYDIIFMDMSMPVMDGFDATRAIRAIEREREGSDRAKIIAFTGLASSTHESKAMGAGVSMFLTKPVSFKEVARILAEWKDASE